MNIVSMGQTLGMSRKAPGLPGNWGAPEVNLANESLVLRRIEIISRRERALI